MFYVYILRCWKSPRRGLPFLYYVGMSKDPDKRFEDHVKGYSKWTSQFESLDLVYKESVSTIRAKAMIREQQIKKLSRKRKELLIVDYLVGSI